MEEIKLNMENLSKEEREQLLKLVEKANKKGSKIWKPEPGEAYYVIDDCGAIYKSVVGRAHDESIDEGRYSIGNCFNTQEEAEFALEKQKVIVELERFAKENNKHSEYCVSSLLVYNRPKHKVECLQLVDRYYPTSLIFSDSQVGMDAIQTIGEDRLIKYYFGVKD